MNAVATMNAGNRGSVTRGNAGSVPLAASGSSKKPNARSVAASVAAMGGGWRTVAPTAWTHAELDAFFRATLGGVVAPYLPALRREKVDGWAFEGADANALENRLGVGNARHAARLLEAFADASASWRRKQIAAEGFVSARSSSEAFGASGGLVKGGPPTALSDACSRVFFEADGDSNGFLDRWEMRRALAKHAAALGLDPRGVRVATEDADDGGVGRIGREAFAEAVVKARTYAAAAPAEEKFFGANPARRLRPARRGVAFARRGRPGSVSRRAVVVPPGPPPSSAFRASRGRARRVASPRPRRRLRVGRRARPRGDAVAALGERRLRRVRRGNRRRRGDVRARGSEPMQGPPRRARRAASAGGGVRSNVVRAVRGLDPGDDAFEQDAHPARASAIGASIARRVGGDARRAVRDALEPLQHDVLRRRRERSVPPRRRSRRRRLPRGRVCVPGGGARVAARARGACLRARSLEAPPRRSGAGWTRAPGATANAPSPKPSRGTSGPSRTRLSRGTFARRSNPRSGRGIPRGRAR